MSIEFVDIMCLFNIMVMKGEAWREDAKYADEVHGAVEVSVTHIILPSVSLK